MPGRLWRINQLTPGIAGTSNLSVFSRLFFRRYAMNSTETNLDLLASRVQKLEASNRRWKLVNSLLVLLAVSVALMGAKPADRIAPPIDRKSTRLNSSHVANSYAVFCLK